MKRPHMWLALLLSCGGVALFTAAVRGGQPVAATGPMRELAEVRLTLAWPGHPEVLELTLFALDDGSPESATRIADGRAAMLARFPGAVVLEPSDVTAQYRLFNIRWPEPHAQWFYNPDGETNALSPATTFAAISAGADGWDGAGGTPWNFTYAGETITPTGCNGIPESIPRDGVNVVGWGSIAGGYLGFSCWWRSASLVDGTPYFEALEFDIVFDPTFAYTADNLQALALHEFGHALGLDHTEPSLCPGRAMCPGSDAMIYTEPQQDDLFGLIALYGLAPTPTATATPSAKPTPSATPTPLPEFPRRSVLPALARD